MYSPLRSASGYVEITNSVNGSPGETGTIPGVAGFLTLLEHGRAVSQEQEHAGRLDHLNAIEG